MENIMYKYANFPPPLLVDRCTRRMKTELIVISSDTTQEFINVRIQVKVSPNHVSHISEIVEFIARVDTLISFTSPLYHV